MSKKSIKIVFLGTPDFAVPALQALIDHNLKPVLVVTQPDEPVGRKQVLTPPPIKQFALANNLEIAQPKNKKELRELFLKIRPEICILVAYGQIIPEDLLNLPPSGFLNIHPSLLPKYRGSSPIQSAILHQEKKTGVSIIQLTDLVDAGPIIAQVESEIKSNDNTLTLSRRLAKIGAELLIKVLPDYLSDKIEPQVQDDKSATLTQIIKREDGQIDWRKTASQIDAQFRAFYPWPGVFTHLAGKRLKIANLGVLEGNFGANLRPGQVFLGPNKELAVNCSQGVITLLSVQLEGKKEMSGKEFLLGQKDLVGQILK